MNGVGWVGSPHPSSEASVRAQPRQSWLPQGPAAAAAGHTLSFAWPNTGAQEAVARLARQTLAFDLCGFPSALRYLQLDSLMAD